MGKRTEHAPGTFSWIELSTTDPGAAKQFYAGLFGWEYTDHDLGEGQTYSVAQVDGSDVGGLNAQQEAEAEAGIPPHWNNYVTVASADEAAAKVGLLGGQALLTPFDVFDLGRMAVIADPTGAVICIWEPKQQIGAELVNAHGALTWNELHTGDIDAAEQFYGEVFGWGFEAMDTGEGNPVYHTIKNGDRMNGGIMNTQPGEPPNWLPYIAVDGLDEAMSTAKEGGGQVHAGPIAMPQGRIAVLQDPQGAFFALWEGELQD